jgi:hypothetical protein
LKNRMAEERVSCEYHEEKQSCTIEKHRSVNGSKIIFSNMMYVWDIDK